MAQTVELPDVIASAVEASLSGVWTALPGRVERYNASNQTANIQVMVQSGSTGESGDRVVETVAVLNSVPVVHLGGGPYRQVFPVASGDTALVVFCSRSLSQWLVRGDIVDPATDQHHSMADGVALVGLRDFKHSLQSAPTDRMSIGNDSGPSIEISASEVRVGSNTGTQPTLLATTFLSDLGILLTAIATQVGLTGGTGSVGAGSAIGTAVATFTNAASTYISSIAKVV